MSASASKEANRKIKASAAASSGDISGRYIGFDPASESHFETSRNWIEACQVHEKCNETVSGANQIQPRNSPLPTRVIEVVREAGQQRVYLRHTDGLQGAYITLTHRWNEFTGQCITTTANLEQRLLGHDFGSLPQLFQDAFTIAERLEIKYIWIDSLCIIQKGDDYTDWKREAPKMAQYYQYSLFTLAGTADDMTGGLMVAYPEEKAPWASSLVQLPYRDKTNAVNGFFYAYKRRTPLVDEYMEQVRSSILFRRGWILQEWLLSKRLLWYTPNGLFYECQQDLPRSYDQSQITFERANPELRSHLQLKAAFHHSNRDILAFWYKALEVYTGQHLTQVTDRVLAVAGLAKEVAPILSNPQRLASMWPEVQNQVYVAGLWLRDIHHGLLWEQAHSASPATTIVEAAPTWSWASLMTPVIWPEKLKGTESAFQVTGICFSEKKRHDIPDQLVHENYKLRPFNAVGETPHFDPTNMFSCLHIRGKLHTVHVRGYLESDENLKNAAISSAYSPIPKSCNWRAICSAFRPEIIAGWVSAERLISPQAACSDYGNAVYALHVSTRYLRHGLWLKRSEPVMDVLLLEKAEDRSGVFRRLGVGRIADRELIKEIGEADEQAIQLV